MKSETFTRGHPFNYSGVAHLRVIEVSVELKYSGGYKSEGGKQLKKVDCSLNLPGPLKFRALTLKLYDFPVSNSVAK